MGCHKQSSSAAMQVGSCCIAGCMPCTTSGCASSCSMHKACRALYDLSGLSCFRCVSGGRRPCLAHYVVSFIRPPGSDVLCDVLGVGTRCGQSGPTAAAISMGSFSNDPSSCQNSGIRRQAHCCGMWTLRRGGYSSAIVQFSKWHGQRLLPIMV